MTNCCFNNLTRFNGNGDAIIVSAELKKPPGSLDLPKVWDRQIRRDPFWCAQADDVEEIAYA